VGSCPGLAPAQNIRLGSWYQRWVVPSSRIPIRRQTAAERSLSGYITAHTSGRPSANPRWRTALAASLAKPWPQLSGCSCQPISISPAPPGSGLRRTDPTARLRARSTTGPRAKPSVRLEPGDERARSFRSLRGGSASAPPRSNARPRGAGRCRRTDQPHPTATGERRADPSLRQPQDRNVQPHPDPARGAGSHLTGTPAGSPVRKRFVCATASWPARGAADRFQGRRRSARRNASRRRC
jgi:hypothetical protein